MTSTTATPPPPCTPPTTNATPMPTTASTSYLQQQQQAQATHTRSPTKQTRTRARAPKSTPRFGAMVNAIELVETCAATARSFAIGELIWGPARGHPAWPGKVIKMPEGVVCTPSQPCETVWVQWFGGGGRSTSELIAVNLLQSLSEGLEAHHKAQKDTRKSRKLNSQLERAIQEAMTELDRISASSTTTSSTTTIHTSNNQNNAAAKQVQQPTSTSQGNSHAASPNRNKRIAAVQRATSASNNNNGNYTIITPTTLCSSSAGAGVCAAYSGAATASGSNAISTTTSLNGVVTQAQQRTKPIRIAPAPPHTPPAKLASGALMSLSQGANPQTAGK